VTPAAIDAPSVGTERSHGITIDLREGAFKTAPPLPPRSVNPWRIYRDISVALGWTDVVCLGAALLLSYYLILGSVPISLDYIAVMVAAAPVWLITYYTYSLYAPWRISAAEEFRRVVSATSLGVVFIVMISFWSHTTISRGWVASTWIIAVLLELAARRLWSHLRVRLRESGELELRTLVVGRSSDAAQLGSALRKHKCGFTPVGFVTPNNELGQSNGLVHRGTVDDLVTVIHDDQVDCLFVEARSISETDMLKVAQAARQMGAEVWLTANLPEVLTSRLGVQPVAGTMALTLRPVKLTGPQQALKRGFDIVIGGVALILVAPLLLAIGVIIRRESEGPALFKQHRVTKKGHVFTVYKFRTMRQDASTLLQEEGRDASEAFFKLGDHDPRITRVGRVLRKTSLDELPQLLNVVKGDMSLVGPRPLPAEQVIKNLELLGPRHEVRTGMTGWWQIRGRSEVEDPREAVRLDLFYIENWSLTLDLYILVKTIGVVLTGRGAR